MVGPFFPTQKAHALSARSHIRAINGDPQSVFSYYYSQAKSIGRDSSSNRLWLVGSCALEKRVVTSPVICRS